MIFVLLHLKSKWMPLRTKTNEVLLVRFAHIGDFIVWLDSAKAYREIYPGKKLTFLCYQYKDVAELAEATGYFDRVKTVNTRGFARIRSLCSLMKQQYDAVIQTNPSRTLLSDLYVLAPTSRQRIAPKSDLAAMTAAQRRKSDRVYHQVVDCDENEMELVRNAQFIRGLSGKQDFQAGIADIPVTAQNPVKGKPYFVLCPGAEKDYQRWPSRSFGELAERLLKKTDLFCVLVGTQKESQVEVEILSRITEPDRVLSFIGKTTLGEYIEVIRGSKLLISCDTSAAHIAPAVGVPCLVFGVGWNKGRFYPYRTEKESGKPFPLSMTAPLGCVPCWDTSGTREGCVGESGSIRCLEEVSVTAAEQAAFSLLKRLRSE